jgi:N-acetylmuramoyl-L-alanine amidase
VPSQELGLSSNPRKYIVAIDAGHGGDADRGTCHNGVVEAVVALALAKALAVDISHGQSFVPVLTRQEDQAVSHAQRGDIAKQAKADLAISIHVNAHADPSIKGGICFHWPYNATGQEVARQIATAWPEPLHRKQRNVIAAESGEDWLVDVRGVLNDYAMTAVLVEVGHATNPIDAAAILQSSVQRGMIAAIECGLARFQQLMEDEADGSDLLV